MPDTASVAGKGEEVTAVVDELVDGVATDQRQRALLGPDEVQQHEHHGAEEDGVRGEVADGDRGRCGGPGDDGRGRPTVAMGPSPCAWAG
jgi:hypothetical protein